MKIRVFMTGLMLITENKKGLFEDQWSASLVDTSGPGDEAMRHDPRLYFAQDDHLVLAGDYAIGSEEGPLKDSPTARRIVGEYGSTPEDRTQARSWDWVLPVSLFGRPPARDLSSKHPNVVAALRLNGDALETELLAADSDGNPLRFSLPIGRYVAEMVMLETSTTGPAHLIERTANGEWKSVREIVQEPGDDAANLLLMNSLPEQYGDDPRTTAPHWSMLRRLLVDGAAVDAIHPRGTAQGPCPQPPVRRPDWVMRPDGIGPEGVPGRPLCMVAG